LPIGRNTILKLNNYYFIIITIIIILLLLQLNHGFLEGLGFFSMRWEHSVKATIAAAETLQRITIVRFILIARNSARRLQKNLDKYRYL